MKLNKGLTPYPVLSGFDDDYVRGSFQADVREEVSFGKLLLDVEYHLEEPGLKQLIDEGKACYVTHVECSCLGSREVFPSDVPHAELAVDLERLADEYYEAQLLDPRRARELQRDILNLVRDNHIDRELQLEGALDDAGLLPLGGDEALDESRLEDEPQPQTLVIDKPVRAGQQVYARGGNLVVLATVSAGAEVIADGDIHIYGSLRGRALAGARGQRDARIFVRSMQAELLSIAGIWRTLEQDLPAALASRPLQVLLESDKIVMRALPD